jgi:hypothetical protein
MEAQVVITRTADGRVGYGFTTGLDVASQLGMVAAARLLMEQSMKVAQPGQPQLEVVRGTLNGNGA